MLYSSHLDAYMKPRCHCYIGTLSWNHLETTTTTDAINFQLNNIGHACFIVNTQALDYPGYHWIACIVWPTKSEVFDSSGQPVAYRLSTVLYKFNSRLECNYFQLQPPYPNSDCGYYCLYYMKYRHIYPTGDLFSFILQHFDICNVYKNSDQIKILLYLLINVFHK